MGSHMAMLTPLICCHAFLHVLTKSPEPNAAMIANLGDNFVDEVEKGNVSVDELNNVGFFFIGKQVRGPLHRPCIRSRSCPGEQNAVDPKPNDLGCLN